MIVPASFDWLYCTTRLGAYNGIFSRMRAKVLQICQVCSQPQGAWCWSVVFMHALLLSTMQLQTLVCGGNAVQAQPAAKDQGHYSG